jgi:hypothetical protein
MLSFFGRQLYAKKLLEYFAPDLNDNSVRSPSTMVKWRDFLVEHAKFPFPETGEDGAVNTTDISPYDVGLLGQQWRAEHAVRDSMLVQKLCRTLEDVVGEAEVPNEREESRADDQKGYCSDCESRTSVYACEPYTGTGRRVQPQHQCGLEDSQTLSVRV